MKYLSPQQVLFIHARLITETGGASGLLDLALIESAVACPRASYAGEELYPGVFEKAAALLDSLVNNHPFVDGNKRAGITSAAMFLRINAVRLACSQEELEVFTMQVATTHPPIEMLANWMKEHSQSI
ncbi:MAG: type II toxin-antitoxin system death-on-curing family toxin [Chloroflexota bacterium]